MSMSTTKIGSYRRLKQKNSASTEESSESTFQINLKPPKQAKQFQNTSGQNSIQQALNEDSPDSLFSRKASHLLDIPPLKKKRDQYSIFDTRNIDTLLASDLGIFKTEHLNESQLRYSNLSNVLNSSGQEDDHIRENIPRDNFHNKVTTKAVGKEAIVSNRNNDRRETSILNLEHSQGKSFLKKYLSLNEVPHICEQSKVDIDIEGEDFETDCNDNRQCIEQKMPFRELKSLQLKKPLNSKQSMTVRVNKNDKAARITLRDYMYQTQVSSRKALISVKETEQQGQINTSPRGSKAHKLQKKQSLTSTQYKNSRYGISPGEMADILRTEICSDVRQVIDSLLMIEKQFTGPSVKGFDPTKEDLLLLYNTRRSIKETIGAQVKQIYRTLLSQKKDSKSIKEELIFEHI